MKSVHNNINGGFMSKFNLFYNQTVADIVVESGCPEGVRRIAAVVAEDINMVTGVSPRVLTAGENGSDKSEPSTNIILVHAEPSPDTEGRCEVFEMNLEDCGAKQILNLYGSDKRGLIYGLFEISERCGVSPLVWWGDIKPQRKESVVLGIAGEQGSGKFVSKEPSVKYRGFFINDEWPAFGRWSEEKFGGFTAKVYEQVFILLLRMKGNYMWPAMWSSTFSEDGPGLASAELADMFGVIMGASHHEPMCRAGSEWQHIFSQYGSDNTWSFLSNRDAITDFWRDGVCRNKGFENIYTIGMRGENDSKLMGKDATLADNINVIKDVILTQHRLLRENVCPQLEKVPRMLAIYKEVEDYYYGDAETQGLRDWEELKDVIFLLSDDNHGNLRGLPQESDRQKHIGGYGMYYHFDYHGAPISYEWVNCTTLYKTREQMSMAWDYGVRDLWIVNVGDLKGNEYPLSYFMELAYDYDRWSDCEAPRRYAEYFLARWFAGMISAEEAGEMLEFIDGFTRWNNIRKPEHMNANVFAPFAYGEGAYVLKAVTGLEKLGEGLVKKLKASALEAFKSMFYYAGMASLNMIAAHVESAMSREYAKNGDIRCNELADDIEKRIEADKKLVADFHAMSDGKWNHMLDSAHTGFMTWNDEKWSYPEVIRTASKASAGDLNSPVDDDILVFEATDYDECYIAGEDECGNGKAWEVIPGLGRLGCALKSRPQAEVFTPEGDAPYVSYKAETAAAGEYEAELCFIARNPVEKGGELKCYLSVNDGEPLTVNTVGPDYYTEWMCKEWNSGVMDGVRTVKVKLTLHEGCNVVKLYPGDPNIIFERMIIYPEGKTPAKTYLGPGRK